jgi:hypothetical protein
VRVSAVWLEGRRGRWVGRGVWEGRGLSGSIKQARVIYERYRAIRAHAMDQKLGARLIFLAAPRGYDGGSIP